MSKVEPRIIFDSEANYLDKIIEEADKNSEAFGFMPHNFYEVSCKNNNVLVALVGDEYAGHLIFSAPSTKEKASIIQTNCKEQYRKRKIASVLMEEAVKELEKRGYIFAGARVASENREANAFYEKMKFYVHKTVVGGQTKRRSINIRIRRLDTPDLFTKKGETDIVPIVNQRFNFLNAIPHFHYIAKSPKIGIDVNIFLDLLGTQRAEHSRVVRLFFKMAQHGIKFFLTEECKKEFERNGRGKDDEAINLLETTQPLLVRENKRLEVEQISQDILKIIFGEKINYNEREVSDARHIAISIDNGMYGFLTRDNRILKKARVIDEKYKICIMNLDEMHGFLEEEKSNWSLQAGEIEIERFFSTHEKEIIDILGYEPNLPNGIKITKNGCIVAFCIWKTSVREGNGALLFIADGIENREEHAEFLLTKATQELSADGPTILSLDMSDSDSNLESKILSLGFQKNKTNSFTKLLIGRILTEDNWLEFRQICENKFKIDFVRQLPKYTDSRQLISYKGEGGDKQVALEHFHHYFSPTLLILPKQDGILIPIRKGYVAELLEKEKELPLGGKKASLYSNKIYYSGIKNKRKFDETGILMLFYESSYGGGRKAIIGIARSIESQVWFEEYGYSSRGVVDKQNIKSTGSGKKKIAVMFDNYFSFKNPVGLEKLRKIGCVDKSNFRSATEIEYKQLLEIIDEGMK